MKQNLDFATTDMRASSCPMGSPEGEPSATLSCRRRGEHTDGSKRRRLLQICGRSILLVRFAG